MATPINRHDLHCRKFPNHPQNLPHNPLVKIANYYIAMFTFFTDSILFA